MQGQCLCGAVKYEISPPFKIFQYCHCSRCRKVTGSAFASNLFVPPEQFQWLKGENYLGRYELAEARYFATCFCKQCGSTLPWTVQGGANIVVPTGTLDEDPGIRPKANIFWASKACWFNNPDELTKFDEFPRKS